MGAHTKRSKNAVHHHGHRSGFGLGFGLIIMLIELGARTVHPVMGFTTFPLIPSLALHTSKSALHSSTSPDTPALSIHHAALQTRNITTAIEFYSLFGYQVASRFRAGPARAAWLELSDTSARLELIEVPGYVLREEPGTRARAIDVTKRLEMLGYNHVALDVTQQMKQAGLSYLNEWLDQLNRNSWKRFQRSLRIAVPPRKQIIGRGIYELAFLYDADGCLIELLHKQGEREQELDSGWEPWNGEGFVGKD